MNARLKKNLKHLGASYLRAVAASLGTVQLVVHGAGVSVSGGWQAIGVLAGAAIAPAALFLTQSADQLDGT